ncbi:hypothetical protein LP420_40325 [Massilia sp. B-10]|nr:hypothetical protein LP420_40325 [Massilia sp. B-10]
MYLIETVGIMRVDKVRSKTADVTLVALSGSIVDFNADLANNVTGINVNLHATGGSIGAPDDAWRSIRPIRPRACSMPAPPTAST